jgi:hypothetical protein
MLSIGELKNICSNIEREYGSDSKICLQILDKEDHVNEAGYCLACFTSKEGTLYLTTDERWSTATQQPEALSDAYRRGLKDGIEKERARLVNILDSLLEKGE